MKLQKIIYWIATTLFCLWMLANAYAYLMMDIARRIFTHLGFPGYFRIELAIAKVIGVTALVMPSKRGPLKEWAYAGFFITIISAAIAHIALSDPIQEILGTVVALILLFASYYSGKKNLSLSRS